MTVTQASADRHRRWRPLTRLWAGRKFGWFEAGFLALILVALGLRLWELEGHALHYDEAIHLHFAWKLSEGKEFIHAPWMHGPFQVELTALIFLILGDSEFTARLGYMLFGTALVALPYFLRDYIGRAGVLLTGAMLTLSPTLLYFSRFGRNDILMAFWATSLLILMWRYLHEGKQRYLYLAAVVLAFMFATKETAYIVVAVFGVMMFLLALPDLVPWALGRTRISQLTGPAGFLLLLVTLTLPQWVAAAGLAQDVLGLTLVNHQGVEGGIVGAPHWASPFVALPLYHFPWWLHSVAAAVLVGGLLWLNFPFPLRRSSRSVSIVDGPSTRPSVSLLLGGGTVGGEGHFPKKLFAARPLIPGLAVPLAVVAATYFVLFRPIGGTYSGTAALAADFAMAGVLTGASVAVLVLLRQPWQKSTLLVFVPALLTFVYLALFTALVDVGAVVNRILPSEISVEAGANAVPVNFVVAGGLLVGALALSVVLGVRWLGGRWLACAALFYTIWATLYTTVFANVAGVFSGLWLGMGYWIAQQDVARGNQPWYYYFVGLSVYELLAVVFGLWGAVYFLRKGDVFGLALSLWAGLTLLAYTIASEKMPWLLVNVTLPFVLLAGKYLGELVENVPWRELLRRGQVGLLVLPPVGAVATVYLVYRYVNPEGSFPSSQWSILAATVLLAILTAYLIRLARPPAGVALAELGVAALLFGFGTVAAFRAAYTYDDSNKEILVYAQGSADLPDTYKALGSRVFGAGSQGGEVLVDYDMWYPLQWYVRHQQDEGLLRFSCFKADGEDGWNDSCNRVPEDAESQAFLLTAGHGDRDAQALLRYQREGPFRDLLWFPESYRRPHENRQDEGFQRGLRGLPSRKQMGKDIQYFKEVATRRKSWADGLGYLIFRELEADWYKSEYYSYLP